MSDLTSPESDTQKTSLIGVVALYAAFAAILLQMIIRVTDQSIFPKYISCFALFVVLYSLLLWRSDQNIFLLHGYLGVQSAIIVVLLSFNPDSDIVTGLFALLCYQVAYFFDDHSRWIWLVLLIVGTVGSLIFYHGTLRGLALGLTPSAAGIALAFLVIANQEASKTRLMSEAIVSDLEQSHSQLEQYADQVEQLAAVEERNRLARALHDSISQTIFSISLTARSTQMLLEKQPDQVKSQLELLQALTSSALTQLRGMVTELRPGSD